MFSELWKAIMDVLNLRPTPLPQSPYIHSKTNLKAFSDTIAWAEGTLAIPDSDNGYRAIVGGGTFKSYADHPRVKVWIPKIGKYSDAAGKWQIMSHQWDAYVKTLNLTDFSPTCQMIWFINSLREINALDDIYAGRFEQAIVKAGNRWASLPGSKFGQSIRTMSQLKDVYSAAGGQFAA
jgi:muramidase (phage lysozyme)